MPVTMLPRTRLGWLAVAVGAAVVLGAVWYTLREEPLSSTTDPALQAKLDAAVAGEPARLAELTAFSWDRVQVFDYGTDDEAISDAVGDPVEWQLATTSYSGPSLWVFSEDGEAVRAVQLDANAPPDPGASWAPSVRVWGGPQHNVVTLTK